MRTEKDALGSLNIDDDICYGINTLRAKNNFPDSGENIHPEMIKAYLLVKKAALETNFECKLIEANKFQLIDSAIEKLLKINDEALQNNSSKIYKYIVVDPLQGGAGTSLNMNINEVIANLALKESGKNFGYYEFIHPLDHVNLSQSTNDTFITALKIASLNMLKKLEDSFAKLQNSLQVKENEFANVIKLGRTQMQDAVPIALGQEFGAYAQAISRDRWRLYNAGERLRSVNLGGTAIGNSVSAPRDYVLKVNNKLKTITGLPIAKAEDLVEATQNLDMFTEVHGIVKAGAVSVLKICNDLRLLSSGPHGGLVEINLPQMQAGSTIMPGKVNPIILESAIQISELIKGSDVIISNIVGAGNLELNSFSPLLSHLFLKSLDLLTKSNYYLVEKCIDGITANEERCKETLLKTSAMAASLIKEFGYDKIAEIVKTANNKNISFVDALKESKIITELEIIDLIKKNVR